MPQQLCTTQKRRKPAHLRGLQLCQAGLAWRQVSLQVAPKLLQRQRPARLPKGGQREAERGCGLQGGRVARAVQVQQPQLKQEAAWAERGGSAGGEVSAGQAGDSCASILFSAAAAVAARRCKSSAQAAGSNQLTSCGQRTAGREAIAAGAPAYTHARHIPAKRPALRSTHLARV